MKKNKFKKKSLIEYVVTFYLMEGPCHSPK